MAKERRAYGVGCSLATVQLSSARFGKLQHPASHAAGLDILTAAEIRSVFAASHPAVLYALMSKFRDVVTFRAEGFCISLPSNGAHRVRFDMGSNLIRGR